MIRFRSLQPFFFLCLHLVYILHGPVHAQYIQEYREETNNGVTYFTWRRTAADASHPVIVPAPQDTVVIFYNCYYMPAICKNHVRWLSSSRAQSRLLNKWGGPSTPVYGFDIDTTRRDKRGDKMCPNGWNKKHSCPESDQPSIMPGPWPHKDTEKIDPLYFNEIAADYRFDANTQEYVLQQRSGRMYTCEEWPPRSFVEGGIGTPNMNNPEGDGAPGYTYCAPARIDRNCVPDLPPKDENPEVVRSEQDWQGLSHREAGRLLRDIAAKQLGLAPKDPNLMNYAVLISVQLLNDPNYAVAGYTSGTGKDQRKYEVPMYAESKRTLSEKDGNDLSPIERVQYMANLTWETVREWKGANFKIYHNGTITSSNSTEALDDIKRASDEYSALGGDYRFGESTELAMNTSFTDTRFATNTSAAPEEMRPAMVDIVTPSNGTSNISQSGDDRDQYGHQEFRHSKPYDILNLGTSYILGNVGTGRKLYEQERAAMNSSRRRDREIRGDALGSSALPRPRRGLMKRAASYHRHHAFALHAREEPRFEHGLSDSGTTLTPKPLHKRDGPVQCGPGSPCKDASCCGPDGKCGFKEHHCGAGCTSNCNAKAMCGIDSADGKTACALNLCCSYYGWCGTEDVHCYDPEPQFGKTPCQQGFGSCQKYPSPSCSGQSASNGRRIGYYQGWNVRDRKCDTVRPSQINTKGLTHLFYSFVYFDPVTYNIIPKDPADPSSYREFTQLLNNGLQTWVAIGGWTFSDPGDYHHAWSDMCSTKAGRAAFIKSLIAFMDQYGFQGVDLDWEYPGDSTRGGRPGDTDNLVLLVKEIQAAFGGRYGLSLTLAPDYWYLRGFKPKAMEPYVDFMGFMAYDLHGPWDSDVKALGSVLRPQTDFSEIYQNLKPLWFDGVNPQKINMGLAYYGRTYKLTDSSCGTMSKCGFKGPGAAGECTAFPGVLSNREIQSMIKKEGLKPYLNETAMVKYVTYGGDNWVGYDDEETLAMKQKFADSLCLGGLMIWSVDFDTTSGGQLPGDDGAQHDSDLIWVSPDIWKKPNPQVYCKFPCTVVLPPFSGVTTTTDYPLVTATSSGSTTIITRPPITVSIWWISTMVVGPSTTGQIQDTITTGVTLLTTKSWPPFTTIDKSGHIIYTSATETRYPPPSSVTLAIPKITFISGLPPRPTTEPYPTPCPVLPGLCFPHHWTDDDDDGNGGGGGGHAGKCKGKHCDPGGCGSSCGGCKLGLLCDLCIGFKCGKCFGSHCLSCKGPACHICVGPNCVGCIGTECVTCSGEDCVSCTKGQCGSTVCADLQCPAGTDPDKEEEEEDEEEKKHRCRLEEGGGGDGGDGGDGGGGGGNGGGGAGNSPTNPPVQTPDFGNSTLNKNTCYDSGQMATRSNMVFAAERFCETWDGVNFMNSYQASIFDFGWQESHKSGLTILARLEAKANCAWTVDKDECNRQFLQIIDGCDQEGIMDKQGGLRENNCLIWRLDPDYNPAAEPPAPPPSQPPPSQPPSQPPPPKGPETKEGRNPRFDIWTWQLFTPSNGVGDWSFGRQAISSYDSYKVCLASYGWSDPGKVTDAEMPNEIKGITKVFGKTCDYDGRGVDYLKASTNSVVGSLKCDGWADASCRKPPEEGIPCFATRMFLRVRCTWD